MNNIRTLTIDLETKTLNPWHPDNIILIGYRYNSTGEVRIVKVCDGQKPDEQFVTALADFNVVKRGHNIHFDLLNLCVAGHAVGGTNDDTRILAYLENPYQELGLKALTRNKLKKSVTEIKDFGRKSFPKRFEKKHKGLLSKLVNAGGYYCDKNTLAEYCKQDVINCDELKRNLVSTKWYREVEQPLTSILFNAERVGMQLDIQYFKKLKQEYEEKIKEVKKGFSDGFNPSSPKQILEVYAGSGRSIPDSRGHTLKLLSFGGDSFAASVLRYRRFSKLIGTYLEPFIEKADSEGRIHGYFNQAGRESEVYGDINGPATGRLSSSDPNLQNIPSRTIEGKRIRQGFIASPGSVLVISDLSQIEPRVLAYYSQSRKLINAFRDNLDTHRIMASDIFNKPVSAITDHERFIGKTGWLQIAYRSGHRKLRFMIENNSETQLPEEYAQEQTYRDIIDSWWSKNQEIKEWEDQHINEVRARGYVNTIGGREIRIPGLGSFNKYDRWGAERQAINYQIQGSAADIIKTILVKLDRELNGLGTITATIHDEIIVECHRSVAEQVAGIIHRAMVTSVNLKNVPMDAKTKICNNWSQK